MLNPNQTKPKKTNRRKTKKKKEENPINNVQNSGRNVCKYYHETKEPTDHAENS